jgi:hypothetical protein
MLRLVRHIACSSQYGNTHGRIAEGVEKQPLIISAMGCGMKMDVISIVALCLILLMLAGLEGCS